MDDAELRAVRTLISLTTRYFAVFKNAPVIMAVIDDNGKVVDANNAAAELIGEKPSGKHLRELLPAELCEKVLSTLEKALEEEKKANLRAKVSGKLLRVQLTPISADGRKLCLLTGFSVEDELSKAAREILRLAARAGDAETVIKGMAKKFGELELFSQVKVELDGLREVVREKDGEFVYEFPLRMHRKKGRVTLESRKELSSEEIDMLAETFEDVSILISTLELESKLSAEVRRTVELINELREQLKAVTLSLEILENDGLKSIVKERLGKMLQVAERLAGE
ncbi:PAS domain-containing protein [Archaeoglobus fulgidus]|uniref:Chemotaxis histidine kinase, putative n=2 Tax=Archaeoglobus fulgidus TaxID=2234 RepID=O29226_ARCFU|nr:PAS domain-containing protein [Archaeoglobus fulgidus]AAB90204.1 chemotaxis histidine kinase, putative [Archaeoglobus fulgidus DSM 4304]AIG97915.1 PAS domain protein S-box [Archaeoglobus fulgidus DSM 8774]